MTGFMIESTIDLSNKNDSSIASDDGSIFECGDVKLSSIKEKRLEMRLNESFSFLMKIWALYSKTIETSVLTWKSLNSLICFRPTALSLLETFLNSSRQPEAKFRNKSEKPQICQERVLRTV